MNGLYYFARKVYQFSQSRPIFEKIGGKIITITEYPITCLLFSVKYGPARVKVITKKFRNLQKRARGLVLTHTADNVVPAGEYYDRVFIYHGTSDKMFAMPDKKLNLDWFEYFFLTGPKDLYKLKTFSHNNENLEDRVVKIGMFRSDLIFTNKYDKKEILNRYQISPGMRKIILYAPTWEWGGGTLKRCFETFAEQLTKDHILIVRPHYNDRNDIRYILQWQKKNKKENLYIFHKQYHDIMDFIYVADLMIGDNSAVNYEFALRKRPIVFVKSESRDIFTPPDEFNIKLCGPIFDPEKDSIPDKVEDAFINRKYLDRIGRLVEKSFYFNDGRAVDRACSFLVDKLSEKGIINREETLKKYQKRFTYMDNYR